MMPINCLLLTVLFWAAQLVPNYVFAQSLADACPVVEVNVSAEKKLLFFEHVFEDGKHDLGMAYADDKSQGRSFDVNTLKRVTFGGQKGLCSFSGLAIARGDDWGWHLVWTYSNKPGIYYARMDGEAWVSSPVKRLSDSKAAGINVMADPNEANISWFNLDDGKHYHVISDDEGRSWKTPQLITQ